MARKIRKNAPTHPLFLFIELVIPWLVMGLAAALLAAAGFGIEVIFIVSVICAIAATLLMREFEKSRRRRQARRGF